MGIKGDAGPFGDKGEQGPKVRRKKKFLELEK